MSTMVSTYIEHREDAGQDAGHEQLADVLLGDDGVDRQHRRGRQHRAQRAAGRDDAGGEGLRVGARRISG